MKCTSSDGTTIAFDRAGEGRPLVLVDAALCHRQAGPNGKLAARVAKDFTVITYDRRGRGESGDAARYSVEREVQDIAALIDTTGGRCFVYGISSGAALALEAAKRLGERIAAVVLYEVPLVVDPDGPVVGDEVPVRIRQLLAEDKRAAAVRMFIRDVFHLPAPLVALLPLFPGWRGNKELAHTLSYDHAIMSGLQRGDPAAPAARWAEVRTPALLLSGGKSQASLNVAMDRRDDLLPRSRRQVLDGQRHYAKADAVAPVITEFLQADSQEDQRWAA